MGLKIVQGGFQEGVWQHDREAYTDEDIESFNEFLRAVAKHRPQAAEVIWDIPPKNKQPDPTLVKKITHP
ncbi:MAG: hypothetical protein JRE23_08505 [Deltaproteobacteria bacterium]|nr:hypothetical protein [Deltaproteobacteria bacterium]